MRVSFHRTLRIPDDGGVYPLPPSLGRFPIHRIEDFIERVPETWRETGGYFIPMYQREALWLSFSAAAPPAAMGLGAGGRMKQKIYPDPHGIHIEIVNSEQYRAITGQNPPPTPIDAATHTRYGFPWFDLYDEHLDDVAPPDKLAGVESVDDLSKSKQDPLPEDTPVKIPVDQVKTYWSWKRSKRSGNDRNE